MFVRSILFVGLFLTHVASAAPDDAVATIGGRKITVKEFEGEYKFIRDNTLNPPSKELYLEDMIRFEVGLQEAAKRKLADDPVVKKTINQAIYRGLLEKELGSKVNEIKVSEKEMQAYYQRYPEIRLSHILIEFKPEATAAEKATARDRANQIYKDVQKSKRPFEELVKLFSDDAFSKSAGGDVGWQTNMTLVPNLYDNVIKMRVGDIRGPIETQYGFHIVKVTGRHAYADADKGRIRRAAFEEKRKDVFDAYFERLKKQYAIRVNKSLLK